MHTETPEKPDAPAVSADPPAFPAARVGKLRSCNDCAREMAKLYRQARAGKIDTLAAARLGNLLNLLIGALRTTEIEDRLATIEEQLHAWDNSTISPTSGD